LRESSKRLSDKYRFIRTLGSIPAITKAFRERDSRINRVHPVKDVAIIEPVLLSPFEFVEAQAGIIKVEQPRILITHYDTDWPFRIEYIEQLLDVEDIWVVVAKHVEETHCVDTPYDPHRGTSLDMIHIQRPNVLLGVERPGGTCKKLVPTEKQLRELEDDKPRIIRSVEEIWIEGSRPEQVIDLFECNILPKRLAMYNCTFYNRDVAHLYLESLSEHLKRYNH